MKPDARLTTGPIGRTLLLFSLPVLGSNILQSLNASINSVWVGRFLGEAALTATSNANIILFFLLGVVFGISMANTIMIGQAVGARDLDEARRVVGTSTTLLSGCRCWPRRWAISIRRPSWRRCTRRKTPRRWQ